MEVLITQKRVGCLTVSMGNILSCCAMCIDACVLGDVKLSTSTLGKFLQFASCFGHHP